MIDVHGELTRRRANAGPSPVARMILTVHDELLFEVRKEAVDDYSALVSERMAGAARLAVPLDVDVGVGENWKEAKS
jgi:DNA polymerase-1